MPRLPPAPDVWWDETDPAAPVLRDRDSDDVFFSRDGGLEESRAVFLAGCGLPEAFAGRRSFAVCELGFGTGLNAAALWLLWRAHRPPGGVLHLVSIESRPLDASDAARALAQFPEAAEAAAWLIPAWPERVHAPQRIWRPDEGFALTVIVDAAAAALARLDGRFDAWFLDGFAPARNPAMWTPDLFARMAQLSRPGARAATYSAAAAVREGLAAAGFTVRRAPGFGRKRHRLEAALAAPKPTRRRFPAGPKADGPIAIVGAGVAGAWAAHALARRGLRARLFEADAPASGASGNPAGLLMPRLDRGEGPVARFFRAADLAARPAYARLGAFTPCGVIQKPRRDADALADLAADPPLPAHLLAPAGDGLLHRQAGVVDPRAAIAALLAGADVRRAEVASLERDGQGWRLRDGGGGDLGTFGAVVIAAGASLARFADLPIERSRGQIEWGPLAGGPPEGAVAAGAYAAPFADGIVFGATFDPTTAESVSPDEASRAQNLAALEALAPDLWARLAGPLSSRAAIRAATPDRMPVMGQLAGAGFEAWAGAWAAGGPAPDGDPPGAAGLYVLGGLGARGLAVSPLLAEALASLMLDEPGPLDAEILEALHPARFSWRALKRRQPAGG